MAEVWLSDGAQADHMQSLGFCSQDESIMAVCSLPFFPTSDFILFPLLQLLYGFVCFKLFLSVYSSFRSFFEKDKSKQTINDHIFLGVT